jgi:hypothetical protein
VPSFVKLGCVDELPHHHPGGHTVNEGQKRATELGLARGHASETFACVERPFHFLASLVSFFIIRDRFETMRLAWDHGFHALLRKHPPHRLAGIGVGHDGGVQLGAGG